MSTLWVGSDVDLPTLHKYRSAEKVEFRLSCLVNKKAHSEHSIKHLEDVFDRLDADDNVKHKRSGTWPRTRSLNAPSPVQHFGPCGRIMKNSAMVMAELQHLSLLKFLTVISDSKLGCDKMVAEGDLIVCLKSCDTIGDSGMSFSKKEQERNEVNNNDKRNSECDEHGKVVLCGNNRVYGTNGFVVCKSNAIQYRTIQDPASQRLTWYKPPLTVLVIKKVRDASVYSPFVRLVQWLIEEKRMVVFVESAVLDDPHLDQFSAFSSVKDRLMTFRLGKDDLTDKIDFIVCLGGDGTLLYASQLFQQSVPPVMAFHLGSLGFLTPFRFDNFEEQVNNVLEGHAALTLRSRLRCIVMKKSGDKETNANTTTEIDGIKQHKPSSFLVLNEVVIDRGPSPYLSNIDLFLDGKHITSVQGDGLIVSTPTGSTAYAVAAGASMIHPSVPAIMVTPICPHSLSFRPIVVPAGVELKISVSPESRNTSWVSFDGRNRQELVHGDSLRVTTSIYPVPSICAQDQISDWFDSLAECLHWNVRKRQKHLDELEDLTHSSSNDTLDSIERESLGKE